VWAVSLQSVAGRLATPLGHIKKKKGTPAGVRGKGPLLPESPEPGLQRESPDPGGLQRDGEKKATVHQALELAYEGKKYRREQLRVSDQNWWSSDQRSVAQRPVARRPTLKLGPPPK